MKSKLTQDWSLPPTWLRFLVIVLLVLGVFFRFYNLDRKVYWHDEVYTSFRVAGYTSGEFVPQVFNGKVINAEDLQKYQRPSSQKGLMDTVKSLEIDDPQHPPLYYLMARLWVQMFGYSVTVIRSLSACISLLVFPCLYWLCLELFGTSLIGWVAIALVAISPVHVLYAQEAREYVLWTVTILLSSAALLQAMRLQSRLSWGIYTVTLAVGFYSFLFTGLVAIGHGIYVVGTEGFRWSKTLKAYLLASLAGLVAFAPWLFVLMNNWLMFQRTTSWTDTIKLPQILLIKTWGPHLRHCFIDSDSFDRPFRALVLPLFLILVCSSIYVLCRQTSKQIWLFILTLIGTTAIPLMLPDLIIGGVRSTSTRYLIPCFLGIQLAVAYRLATQITNGSLLKQKLWQVITAVLISAGVVSCTISSQSQTNSWVKVLSYNLPKVATIINEKNQPLLISTNEGGINVGNVFALSYLLKPTVKLQLMFESNIPQIPQEVSDVFLLSPSDNLKQGIEKKYKSRIEPVFGDEHISLMRLASK